MLRQAAVRVAILSTAMLFASAGAVIVAARLVNLNPLRDPFANLAVLMPGEPLSGVGTKFDCICESYTPVSSLNVSCRVVSYLAGFTQLTFFAQNGVIDRLNVEGSGVTVGDMVSLWGTEYRIQRQGNVRFIRWDAGQYVTVLAHVPFRYYLPANTLSFTQTSVPDRETKEAGT